MCRYAIIGFGCAGYHAAKALRERRPECRIDVYSNTDDPPTNPMLTTYYIKGKIPREQQFPLGSKEDILRELRIGLHCSAPVKRFHARDLSVELEDGRRIPYDGIVLASGSHPLVPPIPGCPQKDVHVMRTVADADKLLSRIRQGVSSALVIGASWVGIKVVEALHAHGVPTVLADMAPRIFPTASLPETAEIIHAHLEKDLGVGLKFGSGIQAMRQEEDGIVTIFQDGSEIKTEIAALCLGLRPTVEYLDPGEIKLGRGVLVNRRMETSVPRVYAAGDCCEAEELISKQPMSVNLWANAGIQGRIAGCNLADSREEFQGNFIHNITHFLDMDFIGAGDNRAQGEHLSYAAPEGWRLEIVSRDGRPLCVNILDNYKLSGPVKAALLKSVVGSSELGAEAAAALRKAGLLDEFIAKMIGGSHGNS
nr:NAD(P)/FAD-dependent oxidoreductase [uncultured Oscillibacter sp.]